MFCNKCGNEVKKGAKFCGACGSVITTEEVTAIAANVPQAPKKNNSKNKKVIAIFGLVAAVVLIVVIVIIALLSGGGDDYYYYDGGYDYYDGEDSQPADGVADDNTQTIQNLLGMYEWNCMPFSDGYAFFKVNDMDPTPLYIVDKQGRICGEIHDETFSFMDQGLFNDGVALLTNIDLHEAAYRNEQEAKLINQNMEVLISAPNENFDNMIGITEDNTILVMKIESTVDGSSVKLGAIDTSGNFVTSLRESGISLSTDETVINASYWGEGIFCVQGKYDLSATQNCRFTNAVLFNVNTGETFDMNSYGYDNVWGSSRDISGKFVNGKAIIASTTPTSIMDKNRDIYLINTKFEIIKTIVADYSFYDYDSYSENGYFYCNSSEQHGYYNENFELVIDLSEYNVNSASEFVDGCAVLEVTNPNGANFAIVIDEKGNQLFDPIEVKEVAYHYSEGLLAADLDDGNITYFDKKGKVSFTIPVGGPFSFYYNVVSCSDGVVTNGYDYYDLTGKKLFN